MTEVIDRFRKSFRESVDSQTPSLPSWAFRERERAFDRFASRGFPTVSDEEFRFTNLAPLVETSFHSAPPTALNGAPLSGLAVPGWDGAELVFVNGRFDSKASNLGKLPNGLVVMGISEALSHYQGRLESLVTRDWGEQESSLRALNHAFLGDGAFVLIPKNTVLDKPIHLLFVSSPNGSPSMSHPFNVIVAESGSQATVLESYSGGEGEVYFTNQVTEILAEDNAQVDHYKFQRESTKAFHASWVSAVQERDSSVSNHSLAFGSRLARNDVRTELRGQGASCELNGLYFVKGAQLIDHHTVIDHVSPHCTSRELYKGVLTDSARAVFNGKIVVRPDAQKTDSEQSNKNLLLSKDALVHSNPQLEIHADDVKCAHGATIGRLDAEALFYLRTRGIPETRARDILTEGFVNDVNQGVRISALRAELSRILFGRSESGASMVGS